MADQQPGKIAIVGLSLIGGSLGLAVKRAGLQRVRVAGYDVRHDVARKAEKMGAIDEAARDVADVVAGASLVIIATPILDVRDAFVAIAPHLSEGAVVTDTASTKTDVLNWAAELLPAGVSFVGGHPMAGKETGGIENAEASLFEGKAYCIIPSVEATPDAIKSVTGLAHLVGADPVYMDPSEHDQYAAAISHMPLVLSTALFTLMRESPSWVDIGAMAGPAFRDLTRLASGDPGMAHGIWRTNREAIIHWTERLMAELARYRDLLQDAQDEALLEAFGTAQIQRDTFIAEPPRRRPDFAGPAVDRSQALLDMFVGGMMADNIRRAQKIPELMKEKVIEEIEEETGKTRKTSLAERMAEGIRRDMEKLEAKRAEKEARKADRGDNPADGPV
jgi:prephenate dehydrogenase